MSEKKQNNTPWQAFCRFTDPQALLLLFCCIVIPFNYYFLFKEIRNNQLLRKTTPYFFLGLKFSGLEKVLHNEQYVGYYTDKDIDEKLPAAHFAQAQYILAPVILDLNNLEHDFILFDCASQKTAFEKIKEIGAVPLVRNRFGIILAKRPGRNRP